MSTKKRVCIYNRVIDDNLSQKTNANIIELHNDWRLIKVYTDICKCITPIKYRSAFQEMLKDCETGKIDIIVTKSVSRFARKLSDCLAIIQRLKNIEHPVGVYFEAEGIYSLDPDSGMILNKIAMLSQTESQNKSNNMIDRVEKRFGIDYLRKKGQSQ